jgi:hypothetical protein
MFAICLSAAFGFKDKNLAYPLLGDRDSCFRADRQDCLIAVLI